MVRTYPAEYVSKVNNRHYLNVDLGFRKWKIVEIELEERGKTEVIRNFGDKFDVQVTKVEGQRHQYKGYIN